MVREVAVKGAGKRRRRKYPSLRDVFQEFLERPLSIQDQVSHVFYQLLCAFLCDGAGWNGGWLVLEERRIIGGQELDLEVWSRQIGKKS